MTDLIIGLIGFISMFLLLTFIIVYYYKKENLSITTQGNITDKDLLLMIAAQPDGFINAEILSNQSPLTKKQAYWRLHFLGMNGILKSVMTKWGKSFYTLNQPIKKVSPPVLSKHPFLSLDDLLILFRSFDYRLSLQDICLTTNLPIKVIKEEMKYFKKNKIVQEVTDMKTSQKFYLLQEPYRSQPQVEIGGQDEINLDLSKIYKKITLDNNL